jgi:hypothetical protein
MVRSQILLGIAETQAKAGQLKAAEDTFALVDPKAIDERFEGQVVGEAQRELALARARRKEAASALKTILSMKDKDRQVHALVDVATALREAGDKEGIRQVISELRNRRHRTHITARIAGALANSGDANAAKQFMEEERTIAQTNDEWVLRDLITAQATSGDISGALAAVSTLSDKALLSGPSQRDWAYMSIADIQRRQGDARGAVSTAQRIQEARSRNETLSNLAVHLIDVGDFRHALEATAAIDHPYWKPTRATCLALTGNMKEATETARAITREDDRSRAFQGIVEARLKSEDLAGALHVAPSVTSDPYSGFAWKAIAIAQAQEGQLSAAQQSVEKQNERGKPEVLRLVAKALIQATDASEVLKWAKSYKDSYEQAFALLGAAEGLLEGRRDKK